MSNNKLIIIAHGWSSTINDWNHIELLLKNSGYIVVNIPFPGLDNKTHINIMLERVWGIPEYSEYVKNIIISEEKKYSPKEIIFIGHSFGGRIGLYIGSHYPGIFTKLILTSSAGINSKVRFKTKLLAIFAKFLKILPIPLKLKEDIRHILRKKFTYDGYSRLDNLMREVFQKVVNLDLREDISRIKIPTIIIWGREDKVTPLWMAEFIHTKIKGSSLKIIDNAGHNAFKSHKKDWLKASELL